MSYKGTNATIWFEIYNSSWYSNVKNYTWIYSISFKGNEAYNYTAVADEANVLTIQMYNYFYIEGYQNLGFPLSFYVNSTTGQLMVATPETDPAIIQVYTYTTGSRVYVYGWSYSVSFDPDGGVRIQNAYVYAHQVDTPNSFNAIGFRSNLLNILREWKNVFESDKLSYGQIVNGDKIKESLLDQTIDDLAEKYGGNINDFVYDLVQDSSYESLDKFGYAIGIYLKEISGFWGCGFPYYGRNNSRYRFKGSLC